MAAISNTTPCIIRETSSGLERTSIFDEMLLERTLVVSGEIEPGMAMTFCQLLLRLEREDPAGRITVYVSSPGGRVSSGLAIYDTLRTIECPVRTVVTDLAASMGSIVFMAGDEREMLPHAEIMIHDPLIPQGAGGSALSVQETARHLMGSRKLLNGILAERSGLTLKRVNQLTGKESRLGAEEALKLGFATAVVSPRKEN